MYKKITHEIVEEQFANNTRPMQGYTNGIDTIGISEPLPSYVMTEITMLFRMDARSAWTKWAFSLMNYAVSLNGNLPGTDQVKGRMHKNAVAIGDFLVPYYGMSAGRSFATALIGIDDIGMHYVEALKAKQPTAEIVKSWTPYISDVAKLMNELNPTQWPKLLIEDILTNLVQAWQDQLTARASGNIVDDEIAIDYIGKLIVTGVPDHIKHGYLSLADVFSRGIIAQFPSMFAE